MALTDNLVSYWKLDEASGNALDAHGSNTLTENGTVGTATGIISNARDFESGDAGDYFSLADNADLSTGDIDFAISAWVNPESLGADRCIVSKYTGDREFRLYFSGGSSRITFEIRWANNLSGSAVNVGVAVSPGNWYHVVAWHDATNDQIGISVNDTSNTASNTNGVRDSAAPFAIGARGDGNELWDGLIDEVGFWKRVLTSTERTELYNGGAGLSYDDFGGAGNSVSATAALTTAAATMAASASHQTPTYEGSAELTMAAATMEASATHTAPTFSAEAALTTDAATMEAAATFTAPVYDGTAVLTTAAAQMAAEAAFATAILQATAALTTDAATMAAAGTFTAPVYDGTAALTTAETTMNASGTFEPPVYSGSAVLTTAETTMAASATFAEGTFTATAALTMDAAQMSASATHEAPAFTASAALTTAASTVSATASFDADVFTASAALITSPAVMAATGTFIVIQTSAVIGNEVIRKPSVVGEVIRKGTLAGETIS